MTSLRVDCCCSSSSGGRCAAMTSQLNDAAPVRRDIDADCYVGKQTPDDRHADYGGYVNGAASTQMDDDVGGPDAAGCAENGVEGRCSPATDDDGYRVEHRFETESVSRCKEVRDLADESTELRMRETKEVTLEELKTRDGDARPATGAELRALLGAQWDDCDEVEISREVVIEQFNRVESEHEEVRPGHSLSDVPDRPAAKHF